MRIAIDVMGGDNAPQEIIKGALMAQEKNQEIELVLVGPKDIIESNLESASPRGKVEIVHASEVIGFDETPTTAIRRKKDSTIVVGLNLVKDKNVQAFVSAGSTGALLAGGLFIVGRIKGIARPALTVFLPTPLADPMLLDVGANADVKAKNLQDFALMGSLYREKILGHQRPRVALLNNGTEEGKGSELTKEAYKLLSEDPRINFVGNIEGRDIPYGAADVVVTDGFTGNVYIKSAEGIASVIMASLKKSLLSSTKGKIAGLLMKASLKEIKSAFDSEEVGGAPFLGIDGILIKAHGNSSAYAFSNAVLQAQSAIEANYIEDLKERFQEPEEAEKENKE